MEIRIKCQHNSVFGCRAFKNLKIFSLRPTNFTHMDGIPTDLPKLCSQRTRKALIEKTIHPYATESVSS